MDENRPAYRLIRGQRVVSLPAEPSQTILQGRLSYLLHAYVAPGYRVGSPLDAAAADVAVVKALVAKGNPEIRQREAAAEAKGKAEGKAESILEILEARGLGVSPAQRQEISSCHDIDRLNRWLRRAAVASSTDEVTSGL